MQNLIDQQLLFRKNLLQNQGNMGPKLANLLQGNVMSPWYTFLCKNWQVWGSIFWEEFGTDSFETSHSRLNLGVYLGVKNL